MAGDSALQVAKLPCLDGHKPPLGYCIWIDFDLPDNALHFSQRFARCPIYLNLSNGMDAPFLPRHQGAKVGMDSIHLKGKERPR